MDPNTALTLTNQVSDQMVRKKVTCPFLGSAVHQKFLAVRGDADNPLASIEDVRRLGNSGGGDLGDLLVMFASGNHAFMRGDDGKLSKKVPSQTVYSRWSSPVRKGLTPVTVAFCRETPRHWIPVG